MRLSPDTSRLDALTPLSVRSGGNGDLRQMCDQLRFFQEGKSWNGHHTRGGQMDILVIEGAASRRVAVAQYLLRATHRVTISSSIEEAREILQFITKKSEAPDAVVIGDNLVSRDATSFREEIADRGLAPAGQPSGDEAGAERGAQTVVARGLSGSKRRSEKPPMPASRRRAPWSAPALRSRVRARRWRNGASVDAAGLHRRARDGRPHLLRWQPPMRDGSLGACVQHRALKTVSGAADGDSARPGRRGRSRRRGRATPNGCGWRRSGCCRARSASPGRGRGSSRPRPA